MKWVSMVKSASEGNETNEQNDCKITARKNATAITRKLQQISSCQFFSPPLLLQLSLEDQDFGLVL